MTKKDFIALAKIISAQPNAKTRQTLAEQHAAVCALRNPRFDRSRFMAACGAK